MERAYSPTEDRSPETAPGEISVPEDNWVKELIAMTRPGVEIEFPYRSLKGRVIPFDYDDFS